MSGVRHWSPTRVTRRARQLLCALSHHPRYWLCPEAIQFLAGWLAPTDIGFQWGSSNGTLWVAKRVQHLTCVEHDPARARKIQALIELYELSDRVTYYRESHGNAMEGIDAAYVRLIDSVTDYSLDFCLVGGPLPAACTLASILKLKYGGLLILENANRFLAHEGELTPLQPDWYDVVWQLAPWRQIWTTIGTTETVIFVKP